MQQNENPFKAGDWVTVKVDFFPNFKLGEIKQIKQINGVLVVLENDTLFHYSWLFIPKKQILKQILDATI